MIDFKNQMLPFSPLLISNALIEGLGAISSLLLQQDKKTVDTIKKILFTQFDQKIEFSHFDKNVFVDCYAEKKANLHELLRQADTGSPDYKRFSFIIQLLWDYMNPELSPFFYEDGTLEKGLSAYLLSTGISKLPSQSDAWNYQVGENLATTTGYVVFENDVLQLLYYPGENEKIKEKPVFIVPPWINKYYIFDLSEHNSYIKWLTKQNIAVYCISWVNPDSTFSGQSFAHYVTKGIHYAVEKAIQHSKVEQINLVGFCVGGIALHVYAGWLASLGTHTIASLTFLSTPFNFEKLDNLRLFISEEQIHYIENIIAKEGVFKGDRMMQTFALLRTNDLIIHAIIDQIYLGKKQKPLDFLFWNADVMHLPGQMHLDFLRDIFLKNSLLGNPKTLSGLAVDFDTVTYPVYVLGTKKDHIVPWESCFSAFDIYKDVTFCLGGAGHVAGIINPPHQKKYGYHTNKSKAKTALDWFSDARFQNGSWWTHWHQWVKPHLGKMRKSPCIDQSDVLEKAPGRYALQKAPVV